jgi:hypothetical protein
MAEASGGRGARDDKRQHEEDEEHLPPEMDVRDEDMEPHEGLRYVARLFKVLAVLLILLLVGEIILGLVNRGNEAIPTLMVEATRIVVFAGVLWGAGDMALMLIESNHDLRATRILVGRLNGKVARLEAHYLPRSPGGGRSAVRGGALGGPATSGDTYTPGSPERERPPSHREGLG